jgi:2Fe-2S ferredoxin
MVDPEWLGRLSAPTENEGEMLDFAATERTAESRLGCQIALVPALDGMVVRVPASQV